jgi:hypothetical protein
MTVVEAHFIGTKLDPCDDVRAISRSAAALLIEGIAQNTTGTVFLPEVYQLCFFLLIILEIPASSIVLYQRYLHYPLFRKIDSILVTNIYWKPQPL